MTCTHRDSHCQLTPAHTTKRPINTNININSSPPVLSQPPRHGDLPGHHLVALFQSPEPIPCGSCAGSQHPPCLLAASPRACPRSCFLLFVLVCSVCLFVPSPPALLEAFPLPFAAFQTPSVHATALCGRQTPKWGPAFLLLVIWAGHKMIHQTSWGRGNF